MKTNKALKKVLVILLSAVVLVCSIPTTVSAIMLDAEDVLSDKIVSEDTILVESVSADNLHDTSLVLSESDWETDLNSSNIPNDELANGDSVTFKFYVGKDNGYLNEPKGYWFNGLDMYTADQPTKMTANASVRLLDHPFWTPVGKQFIGWESNDGKWAGGEIPLSLLTSAKAGEDYVFTAVYKDYKIWYNILDGRFTMDTGCFMDPGYLTSVVDGVDAEEKDTYKLLASGSMVPNSSELVFTGWEKSSGEKYTNLSEYEFEKNDMYISLNATFDKIETYTLTLSNLTGIDQDYLNALKVQGFTVEGDTATRTFTSTDSKFYLPALSKPGSSFLGWYETDKSPSTASPYVEFDPATSYDISYTASFQEDISISLRSSLTLYEGQSFSLSATVRPENVVQTVTWTNSDSEVVSLTGSMVKAIKAGTCDITATSVADPSKKAVCKVTVLKSEVTETDEYGNPIDPGSYAMDENGQMNIWIAGLDKDGYHYTGYAIKPEIHVYNGKELLREGVDYTLSYKNNTKVTKASSKPQISIKMKGQYAGSETAYFEIVPTSVEDLEAKDAKINVSYDKKKHQIKPTLTYQGKDLKAGNSDLVFKWFEADASGNATDTESACIDPGLYAVKVYAGSSGNFTSSAAGYQIATITVQGDHGKIPMSNVKLNNFKTKMTYNGGVAVEQADVTLSCKLGKATKTLVLGEDYTVSYKNNYDIGTASAIYEATESGEFVGKITKDFSITGKYTLDDSAGGNAIVTLEDDSFEFTNAAIKPDVTVQAKMVNNDGVEEVRTLVQGKDYTVSYKNNKSVADATADKAPQAIVKGKGNYTFKQSSAIKRFSITKPELSSQVVTIPDKPYNKKPNAYKSVKILITDRNYNDLKLKAGKDYTVEYVTPGGTDTPVAGQTVEVVITATETSSYTGSVTGSYRITEPKDGDITKAKAIVNPDSKGKTKPCAYTGDAIEPGQTDQPGLILTSGSGKKLKTLTEGVDYEIIGYYNNILPSKKAIILVRGIGEYKGIKAFEFTITAKPVSSHWGGIFG